MAKNDSTKQKYDFNEYQNYDFDRINDLVPKRFYSDIVSKTLDITGGLSVVIKMLEINSLDRECDGNNLMRPYDEGVLFRFASRAAEMLYEDAEESLSSLIQLEGKDAL